MTQGPPLNLTPQSLVALMSESPRPSKVVDYPGIDNAKLRIVVPPIIDHSQARALAECTIRLDMKTRLGREPTADDLSSDTARQLIGDETAMEMMARCCVGVEPIGHIGPSGKTPVYPRLFADAKWIRDNLSAQQVAILFSSFMSVVHELGPEFQFMGDDELDAWLRRLQEGMWSMDPLSCLASLDLAELTLCACKEVVRLRSLGSRPRESPSESSPSSSRSDSETSATDTSCSGEPPAALIPGPRAISTEEAIEIARRLPR